MSPTPPPAAKSPPAALASLDPNAPPPLLGTWPRVYLAVIASQVVFVVALALLSEVCS